MKNNIKIIIGILAISITFSCTKLDEKVYSSVAADHFFRNEQEVMLNVGRTYSQLRQIMNRWGAGSMSLVTSGECIIPFRETNLWWDNGTWIDLYKHNFASNNPAIGGGWSFCFDGISICNQVLYQVQSSPVQFAKKESIIAEIKILRAFYYYKAIDWFGNIPITTDFKDTKIPPQRTRAEVFQFIEKEINENVVKLDPFTTAENYGRVTQAMAYTMLAKLYLNANAWTGVAKWDEAAKAAEAVISMGHYTLSPDYFSNFAVQNETSNENIFVVPYDKVNTGGWDDGLILHCWSLHFLSSQTFGFIAFTWDGYAGTESLYNSYDKKDKRINTWLEGPQVAASGEPLMLAPGRQLTYRPHVKSLYNLADVALLDDGVRFKKYEFEKTLKDGESMSNDWVEFRYADVLMIKAEALMRKNGAATAEVLALVNQVRSRAYGGNANNYTTTTLTMDEFLAELGREFAWENHRRQDLIRFDKWNNAWFEKPAGDNHLKLFPIPNWVLDVSPQLKQNSGY